MEGFTVLSELLSQKLWKAAYLGKNSFDTWLSYMAQYDDLQNFSFVSWRLSSDATLVAQLQSLSASLQQPHVLVLQHCHPDSGHAGCSAPMMLNPPHEFLQVP